MIRSCLVSIAIVAGLAAAQAQTPVVPTPAPTAPMTAQAPAPSGAKGGLAQKECRSEVDAKPLTGEQRKGEMHTCMQAHRQTCAQTAEAQNIPKGAGQRRDFMRKCMQGT